MSRLLVLLSLAASAAGFVVPTVPLHRPAASRVGLAVQTPLVQQPLTARPTHVRASASPTMGLFGLGWPEIGVIGVIALFVIGPDKLAPMAKEFGPLLAHASRRSAPSPCNHSLSTPPMRAGKSAGGLKEVTDSFKEGMAEGDAGLNTGSPAEDLKSAEDVPTVTVEEKSS